MLSLMDRAITRNTRRIKPSTRPVESPATVPAAVGIPTHEALEEIFQAASRGPVNVRSTRTLTSIERDRKLAGSFEHRNIIADRGHGGIYPALIFCYGLKALQGLNDPAPLLDGWATADLVNHWWR